MKNKSGLYPEQIITYTSLYKPLSVCRQEKKARKQILESIINASNKTKSCQESTVNTPAKIKQPFLKQSDTEIIEPGTTIRMFNHTFSNFKKYAQRIFSKVVKTETTQGEINKQQKSHDMKIFKEIVYLKRSQNALCRPKVCKLGTETSHLSCQQAQINKSSKISDISLENSAAKIKWNRGIYTYSPRSQMKKKIATLRQRSMANSRKRQLDFPNSLFSRKK